LGITTIIGKVVNSVPLHAFLLLQYML